MNKKDFLKVLEKKLMVLDELERNDIINEYKDTIEEKVKHGQTEIDAVKDFGSIDDLSKEILSAYKINPDYGKDSDLGSKAKDVLKSTESFVKVSAKKLSDFTKNVVEDVKKNKDITPEYIFEIIIKVFIFLVICAVLRFPFWIIEELGSNLFNILFPPFNAVFRVIWIILINIMQVIVCIMIGISMFKEYFHPGKNIKKEVKKEAKSNKKTKTSGEVLEKKLEGQETKYEKIEENKVVDRGYNSLGSIIMIIIRIFVVICFLIPIWCANLGIWMGIIFFIYILIKGVNVVGILLILFGCATLFWTLGHIINNLIFMRRKVHFFLFGLSFILIFTGGLITMDNISNYTYYNESPLVSYDKKELVYDLDVTDNMEVYIYNGDKDVLIDNELPLDKMVVKIYYYEDFINYRYNKTVSIPSNTTYVNIDYVNKSYRFNINKEIFNIIIRDLKHDKLYNYSKLFDAEVKIYTNEINIDKIK